MGKPNLDWATWAYLARVGQEWGYDVGLQHTDEEIAAWIKENRTHEGTLAEAVALLKKPLLEALEELQTAPLSRQIEIHEETLNWLRGDFLTYQSIVERVRRDNPNLTEAGRQEQERLLQVLENQVDQMRLYIETLKAEGGRPRRKQKATAKPPLGRRKDIFVVSSAGPYRAVQEGVAEGLNGMDWPTPEKRYFNRRHRTKDLDAELQVRPEDGQLPIYPTPEELKQWQDKVTAKLKQMNDETVDCLDVVTAKWLDQARHPEEGINLNVNELLQARGLKPRRTGGYDQKARQKMAQHVETLGTLWLKIHEATRWETVFESGKKKRVQRTDTMESRVLDISLRKESTLRGWDAAGGDVQYFSWRLKPGLALLPWVAGDNRQLAWLSTKALQYDPYKQKPEKRLLRYLSWQWRIRRNEGNLLQTFTTRTLLEGIRLRRDPNNPIKTKDRLEKALDTLLEDKLINAWQYDGWDESRWTSDGWAGWTDARVLIEPPQHILDQAAKITAPPQKKLTAATQRKTDADLPRLLKDARLARGITQLQAVEQIQDLLRARNLKPKFSQAYFSAIEAGKKEPGDALKRLLLEWAQGNN